MPEPSNEWVFPERRKSYSKVHAAQIKNFSMRLKHTNTVHQLEIVRRDILRSALVSNAQAIQELRGIGNNRAQELKYQSPKGEAWWN